MISDLAVLGTSLAALAISCLALFQQVRQRKNEIRPLLVLIERPVDASEVLGLYLVNMGNAAAMDVDVTWLLRPPDLPASPAVQAAVAGHRRIALATGHIGTRLHQVELLVHYRDLDGKEHSTKYTPPASAGGRGKHVFDEQKRS